MDFIYVNAVLRLRFPAFFLTNALAYPRDGAECGLTAVFPDGKGDAGRGGFGVVRHVPTDFLFAVLAVYPQKSGDGIGYALQLSGRHPVKIRVDIVKAVTDEKLVPVGIQTDVLADADAVFLILFYLAPERGLFPFDKPSHHPVEFFYLGIQYPVNFSLADGQAVSCAFGLRLSLLFLVLPLRFLLIVRQPL